MTLFSQQCELVDAIEVPALDWCTKGPVLLPSDFADFLNRYGLQFRLDGMHRRIEVRHTTESYQAATPGEYLVFHLETKIFKFEDKKQFHQRMVAVETQIDRDIVSRLLQRLNDAEQRLKSICDRIKTLSRDARVPTSFAEWLGRSREQINRMKSCVKSPDGSFEVPKDLAEELCKALESESSIQGVVSFEKPVDVKTEASPQSLKEEAEEIGFRGDWSNWESREQIIAWWKDRHEPTIDINHQMFSKNDLSIAESLRNHLLFGLCPKCGHDHHFTHKAPADEDLECLECGFTISALVSQTISKTSAAIIADSKFFEIFARLSNAIIAGVSGMSPRDSVAKPDLNNNASLDPEEARALHRVVRAMNDGNCPKCGTIKVGDVIRAGDDHGQKYWWCQACDFKLKDEDAQLAIDQFGKFMRANFDVFQRWMEKRREKSSK